MIVNKVDVATLEKARDLLFSIRRSVRYHIRRRRFFDNMNRFMTAAIFVLSAGAVVSILSKINEMTVLVAAAAVTVLSIINLVSEIPRSAWTHADLARSFAEIEKQIILKGDLTEEDLKLLTAQRLELEKDEPPIMRMEDIKSHNELVKALGLGEPEIVRLPYLKSLTSSICNWDVTGFDSNRNLGLK